MAMLTVVIVIAITTLNCNSDITLFPVSPIEENITLLSILNIII